jgi:hypothetical protein
MAHISESNSGTLILSEDEDYDVEQSLQKIAAISSVVRKKDPCHGVKKPGGRSDNRSICDIPHVYVTPEVTVATVRIRGQDRRFKIGAVYVIPGLSV